MRRQKNPDNKYQSRNQVRLSPLIQPRQVSGDWLIIREMSDPEKLNPIVSNDASASEITYYVFEYLLDQDRETYELIPRLSALA